MELECKVLHVESDLLHMPTDEILNIASAERQSGLNFTDRVIWFKKLRPLGWKWKFLKLSRQGVLRGCPSWPISKVGTSSRGADKLSGGVNFYCCSGWNTSCADPPTHHGNSRETLYPVIYKLSVQHLKKLLEKWEMRTPCMTNCHYKSEKKSWLRTCLIIALGGFDIGSVLLDICSKRNRSVL